MVRRIFLSLFCLTVACAGPVASQKPVPVSKITPEEFVVPVDHQPFPIQIIVGNDYQEGVIPTNVLFELYDPIQKKVVSGKRMAALKTDPGVFPFQIYGIHYAVVYDDKEIRLAHLCSEEDKKDRGPYCFSSVTFIEDYKKSDCLPDETGNEFCGTVFRAKNTSMPVAVIAYPTSQATVVSTSCAVVTSSGSATVVGSGSATQTQVISSEKDESQKAAPKMKGFEPVRLLPDSPEETEGDSH